MDKQERIDRAVIDLGGALPRHSFDNRKEGQYYVDGRAIKQVRGLTTKHICNIDEFMEARKRLIDRGGLDPVPDHIEPRPHPDHKEGEGVEWEPGVDLPPIHEQCCALLDDGVGWVDCIILAHTDVEGERVAVFQHSRGVDWGIRQGFRKLKSHREKVIEAVHDFFMDKGSIPHRKTIGKAYDAGFLKLPGEEG